MMVKRKELLRDPDKVFVDPTRLVERSDLTKTDKLELLEQWRLDLIELQQAADENMPSANAETGDTAEKLRRVSEAIVQLESTHV